MTAWKEDGNEHSNKCKGIQNKILLLTTFMTPHSNSRIEEYFKFAKNANFPGPAAHLKDNSNSSLDLPTDCNSRTPRNVGHNGA